MGPRRAWKRRGRPHALLLVCALALVAASAAYAYTTSIGGVTPPIVGSGSGSIGKYSLSSVDFVVNGDPRNIDSVSFTLGSATSGTTVRAQLAGNWYACNTSAAPSITCATTSPQVHAADISGHDMVVVASG
jgi:hypothetical protein